jgi:hypothetical protein
MDELPQQAQVFITAFALNVEVFDDEEAYYAAQASETKFASKSFLPVGMFSPEMEPVEPPEPYAILTGEVLDVKNMTNSLTTREFIWMKVESAGANYEVVSSPDMLNKIPRIGDIVKVLAWLEGDFAVH